MLAELRGPCVKQGVTRRLGARASMLHSFTITMTYGFTLDLKPLWVLPKGIGLSRGAQSALFENSGNPPHVTHSDLFPVSRQRDAVTAVVLRFHSGDLKPGFPVPHKSHPHRFNFLWKPGNHVFGVLQKGVPCESGIPTLLGTPST